MGSSAELQTKIRVPEVVKAYLSAEAVKNRSSQNSEAIRAIRERMERSRVNGSNPGSAAPLNDQP